MDFENLFASLRSLPQSEREQIPDALRILLEDVGTASAGRLSESERHKLIDDLPKLSDAQVNKLDHKDAFCPICLNTFASLLAEEEMALAMDSPAYSVEELGITRMSQPWQCGHMFCRRDIVKWIQGGHDSCPLCRRLFIERTQDSQDSRANVDEGAELRVALERLQELMPIQRVSRTESNSRRDNDFSAMYS